MPLVEFGMMPGYARICWFAGRLAESLLSRNMNSPVSIELSVIVPTYREVESLPHLLPRLLDTIRQLDVPAEVLIMDDQSNDGTVELVDQLGISEVRLCVREGKRGLSPAVVDGFRMARGKYLVCIDADLSHPPETIPTMLERLAAGADFVIGSRYVPGGSTEADWGFFRQLNSSVATFLARPFTSVKDPMSGFIALTRERFNLAKDLNPIGYKIGLELLVKCGCQRVAEVPIHFANRAAGESKLSLKEQLRYIKHLRRLFVFKYPNWSYIIQFGFVGAVGTGVNLGVLTLVTALGVPSTLAIAAGIIVSLYTNFLLNRRFTFGYSRYQAFWPQFAGFVAASALGAVVNYITTLMIHRSVPTMPIQIAAVIGVAFGMVFNYLSSRYMVFRKPKN
jgi:dolichol-phosphate mannosyltransferase